MFFLLEYIATRRHQCEDNSSAFCYIGGYIMLIFQRQNITSFVKQAYKVYFRHSLGEQDRKWAPYTLCHNCKEMPHDWIKVKCKGLPFGIWPSVNQRITQLTAIFVWSIQKVLARKTDIKSLILLSHQQFNQLYTLMSYLFQFLLSCLHLRKRVSMKC